MGFALKMRGLPKDEIDRRVREAARILGLTESLQKKPRTLSGGQRQRVAMGRAIVRNPQAFLMDEPLSNLDAKLRVEMRAEIARIQRDLGVTTVYVTHDQTEAMTMGDRCAVMRGGLLQQVASPQELYERPRKLFVAEFIGSPAMNLVEAGLERSNGDLWVRFGDQRLRLDRGDVRTQSGLERFEGRRVVLGIRPEDMEDAAIASDSPAEERLSVVCDIREDMGSEVYVHFDLDARARRDAGGPRGSCRRRARGCGDAPRRGAGARRGSSLRGSRRPHDRCAGAGDAWSSRSTSGGCTSSTRRPGCASTPRSRRYSARKPVSRGVT